MRSTRALEIEVCCKGINSNIFKNLINSEQDLIIKKNNRNTEFVYALSDGSMILADTFEVEEIRENDHCEIYIDGDNGPKIKYTKSSIDLAESLAFSRGYAIDFNTQIKTNHKLIPLSLVYESNLTKL